MSAIDSAAAGNAPQPAEELRAAYLRRGPMLELAATELHRLTTAALNDLDHHHIDRVSFRVKGMQSFLEKATERDVDPPYGRPLVEIEDQVAGRVLVLFRHDIDSVVGRLRDVFVPVESTRREPTRDDEFGYESYHYVALVPETARSNEWRHELDMPETFELQVRTLFMHAWAEPQHDIGYKGAQDLTRPQRRALSWVAASSWGADRELDRVWTEYSEQAADKTS